jgi:hypothetical protein
MADELLKACIHEAGHWMAFAHYKIPVVEAKVTRGSRTGAGIVIPTNSLGLVPNDQIMDVEYIATLAGAYAINALNPFVDRKTNIATSMGDVRFARDLLDDVHGTDTVARKKYIEKSAPLVSQLIHQNWSIVEALAYELMIRGNLDCSQCQAIEMRYGTGRHALTPARIKSANNRLAAFHSSPDALLVQLLAAH